MATKKLNDLTVTIFDTFYDLNLSINANDYEVVHSFFVANTESEASAQTYTETLFRIANVTGENVLTLLNQVKGLDAMNITLVMAYFLNTFTPKYILFGVSEPVVPNYTVQRNIVI